MERARGWLWVLGLALALVLLAIGATGYGPSLRFYLLAQRAFGAARTGSVFAFAPFIGAAFAVALGDRSAGWLMALGSVLMLAGVLLHLAESHGHEHEHEALEHEHAHRHDDAHHGHSHDPAPTGEHSHRHRHEPPHHAPAHAPDAHHGHRHRLRARRLPVRSQLKPGPPSGLGLRFSAGSTGSEHVPHAERKHRRIGAGRRRARRHAGA